MLKSKICKSAKALALALVLMCLTACNRVPQPTPGPITPVDPTTVVAELLTAHNGERSSPLVLSPALTRAAQKHSEYQASTGRMSHTGANRSDPFQRMEQEGYRFSYAGENVAYGQENVAAAMTAWMGSSGHRANILSSNYTEVGFGYALGFDGRPYWTADFGRSSDEVKRGLSSTTINIDYTVDASSIRREP